MRYQEISSGLRIPISGEEQDVINLSDNNGIIARADLDERGREVARLLVSRGVIDQYRDHKQIFYHVSSVSQLPSYKDKIYD